MPQLVKGGKHVFGWSLVGIEGRIRVPPEAIEEYGLKESDRLILMPGSRTSGGFGLALPESIEATPIGRIFRDHPEFAEFRVPEGKVIRTLGRPCCWTRMDQECIRVPAQTLAEYGIRIGDKLLVIRGSGLALGFAVRGPIVEEAKRHGELFMFEP